MALKITTTNITDIRIGTAAVDKIYAGTDLVWQRAIQYVSSASVAGTSLTMPTHQAGDLLLMWAYRDGNTTSPTLPSGWTSINANGANTNSARIAYKFAASSSETSGTWTSATGLVCHVYRYARGIGRYAVASGTSTGLTIAHPALTLLKTDGTSWGVRFAGHRSANVTTNTPSTAPNTFRAGTSNEAAGWDSNGVLSANITAGTQVVSANSGYQSAVIEIVGSAITELVRQRMNKNGNQAAGAGQVTSWSSDGTYPATVTSNDLVVQGTGVATITASISYSYFYNTGAFQLLLNGTQIGATDTLGLFSSAGGPIVTSLTVSDIYLVEGDTVRLQRTGNLSVNATSTYVDVSPTDTTSVRYDTSAVSSGSFAASQTASLTIGASGAAVIAVVGLPNGGTISSVTCGGVAMTLFGTLQSTTRMYYLTGVAAGATNVVVTLSGLAYAILTASSYLNVGSIDATSWATSGGTSSGAAINSPTVTVGPKDMAVFATHSTAAPTVSMGDRRQAAASIYGPPTVGVVDLAPSGTSTVTASGTVSSSYYLYWGSIRLIAI